MFRTLISAMSYEFTFRPDIDSHLALYIVKARNSSERQEGTTQRGWVEMVNASLMSDMLTIREVSRMLHVHPNTLRRWSDQGKIRAYRIAARGDRRFLRQDVAHFIADLNSTPEDSNNPLSLDGRITKIPSPSTGEGKGEGETLQCSHPLSVILSRKGRERSIYSPSPLTGEA